MPRRNKQPKTALNKINQALLKRKRVNLASRITKRVRKRQKMRPNLAVMQSSKGKKSQHLQVSPKPIISVVANNLSGQKSRRRTIDLTQEKKKRKPRKRRQLLRTKRRSGNEITKKRLLRKRKFRKNSARGTLVQNTIK